MGGLRRIAAAFLLGLPLALGLAVGAKADILVLVGNIGRADGGTTGLGNDLAQAFTTGSNSAGYNVDHIDVEFAGISDGDIWASSRMTATIRSNSNGSPGDIVGTLTNPSSGTTFSDRLFTFATSDGGIDLAADTTYFFMLDIKSASFGTNTVRNTAADDEDPGTSGWTLADTSLNRARTSTGAWTSNTESGKIRISGKAKPNPVTLSIEAPADADEGNSSTTSRTFELRLSESISQSVSYRLCYDGTATRSSTTSIAASADYYPRLSGVITTTSCVDSSISAGGVSGPTHSIVVKGDTDPEADETVNAVLSLIGDTSHGVTLGTDEVTHTILNDDGPEITITRDAASITESGFARFTVHASPAPTTNLRVLMNPNIG